MIKSSELGGLAVAVLGHAGLLALLLFFAGREGEKPVPTDVPIEVSLADDIGMTSSAPEPSKEPPAQQKGDDAEMPDTAVAPPEDTPEPEPVKPKPEPPKPAPAETNTRKRPDNPSGKPPSRPATNRTPSDDFRKLGGTFDGPAKEKTDGTGTRSQASATGAERASFVSAVKRQVQPCADRQNIPDSAAESIVAVVQLRLKRDGSLEEVRILRHDGVNDGNSRYVTRVDDAVEAIFRGCTPIRGMPAELYDVPGGWKSLKFNYQMGN